MTIDRDTDRAPDEPPPSAVGAPFEGAPEFGRLLYQALRHAESAGARRLCWSDGDFAAWPLGEPGWISMLTRWARAGNRELVMIASDYRAVQRLHPRFATWRRDWSHLVQCLVPDEARTEPAPTLWVDSTDQVLRVFDREHFRGRAGFDRVDRQRAREDFDAILQRATPGFAAATLGL